MYQRLFIFDNLSKMID